MRWWRRHDSDLPNAPVAARDELLSAYVDGALDAPAVATLERALAIDPALRAELDELRALRAALAALEPVRAPRAFTLTSFAIDAPALPSTGPRPALARPRASRLELAMRAGAVAAAIAGFAVFGAGLRDPAVERTASTAPQDRRAASGTQAQAEAGAAGDAATAPSPAQPDTKAAVSPAIAPAAAPPAAAPAAPTAAASDGARAAVMPSVASGPAFGATPPGGASAAGATTAATPTSTSGAALAAAPAAAGPPPTAAADGASGATTALPAAPTAAARAAAPSTPLADVAPAAPAVAPTLAPLDAGKAAGANDGGTQPVLPEQPGDEAAGVEQRRSRGIDARATIALALGAAAVALAVASTVLYARRTRRPA